MSAGDTDYDFNSLDPDLGGLTKAEVMGRGRVPQLIEHSLVATMAERVNNTGALVKIAEWRRADAPPFSIGGRPALISDRAVLTGLLLLAKEGSAMFLTLLAELFQSRLSDESRELLGVEPAMTSFIGHTSQQKRWYDNTARAFHRISDLMDPYPQERRRAKTLTEIQEILNNHDTELAEKRKARLDEFTRLFVVMTFNVQPRDVRRASKKMDLSFDQTFVRPATTKGYARKHLPSKVAEEARLKEKGLLKPGPVEAFGGWHVRTGERKDAAKGEVDLTAPDAKKASLNYVWALEANFAVRVDAEAPGRHRFPSLIVGATISLPNIRVAEEAVSLMRSANSIGLEPGVSDADKQYWANSTTDRLHDPAIAAGFTPSTDYRVDRLGVQGGANGALFIEGGVYCPGTPKALQNATKDFMSSGKSDPDTYHARIGTRKAFQLHQKEKPDAKGRVPLTCPAIGPSPTVTCPLRELLKTATPRERPAVHGADVPDFVDKICKQHSASFKTADMQRQAQAFEYGSKEWAEFHRHARNSIESLNAQVKAGGTEDIESAGRRRVRGLAAAQVIITMLVTNFNIRKIAAFISDKIKADARSQTTGPTERPRRSRDSDWHNPYTGTYPAGITRPSETKPAPSDETGGPPVRT
jgi:hypothetical protein